VRRWRDCSAAKDVGLLDDGMAEAGAHCGDWVKAAQAIPDLSPGYRHALEGLVSSFLVPAAEMGAVRRRNHDEDDGPEARKEVGDMC